MCFVTFSWEKPDSLKKIEYFKKKKEPKWAEIDVTTRCNFSCKWCYMSCASNKEGIDIKRDDYRSIINTLKNSGIIQITISGGEPLMHPDIIEFVSIASKKGMIVHINSNGWYLNREMAGSLKKAGLSQIQMNIDSLDTDKHESIRGKNKSFEHVLRAFTNAKLFEITSVVETVLTKENIGEIKDIMTFSRGFGINRVRVWDMLPVGSGKNQKHIVPDNYNDILDDLTKHAINLGARNIISYEPGFPRKEYPVPVYHLPCPARLGAGLVVKPDGDVKYCCTQEEILYNVLEHRDIRKIHKRVLEKINSKLKDKIDIGKGCPSRCI